jgi:hypothetical protein
VEHIQKAHSMTRRKQRNSLDISSCVHTGKKQEYSSTKKIHMQPLVQKKIHLLLIELQGRAAASTTHEKARSSSRQQRQLHGSRQRIDECSNHA